jgi:hypothetical protein
MAQYPVALIEPAIGHGRFVDSMGFQIEVPLPLSTDFVRSLPILARRGLGQRLLLLQSLM